MEMIDSNKEPSSFLVRNVIGIGGERCDHGYCGGKSLKIIAINQHFRGMPMGPIVYR